METSWKSGSLTTSYDIQRGGVLLAVGEMKTAYCVIPVGAKLESAEIPSEYFDRLTSLLQSSGTE